MNLLNEHIRASYQDFDFCIQSFYDDNGNIWKAVPGKRIIEEGEVWETFTSKKIDFEITIVYYIDREMYVMVHEKNGDDIASFDFGYKFLDPDRMCKIVKMAQKQYKRNNKK